MIYSGDIELDYLEVGGRATARLWSENDSGSVEARRHFLRHEWLTGMRHQEALRGWEQHMDVLSTFKSWGYWTPQTGIRTFEAAT